MKYIATVLITVAILILAAVFIPFHHEDTSGETQPTDGKISVSEVNDVTFYMEETEGYRLVIGFYPNASLLDCAMFDLHTNTSSSALIRRENAGALVSYMEPSLDNFREIRNRILNGAITLASAMS